MSATDKEDVPSVCSWGTRPDGSPWTPTAGSLSAVRAGCHPGEWEEKARGLLAAAEWIRFGRTTAMEAERAKGRG